MKYIGIDPSSTATGIGILNVPGLPVEPTLLDFAVVRPQSKIPSIERIKWTCGQIIDIIKHEVILAQSRIIIEVPSSLVHDRTRFSRGLAVYGFAAGAVWSALDNNEKFFDWKRIGRMKILTAEETKWTGGFSKERRKTMVETLFPNYESKGDKGLDAMDAIAIAVWLARKDGAM